MLSDATKALAVLLFGDLLVLRLLELTNQKLDDMHTRYTNMKKVAPPEFTTVALTTPNLIPII